jgi:hypothetical protein
MPGSPVQAFPYPSLADPANGPTAFQALAVALDPRTNQVYANIAARTARVAIPSDGMVAYMLDSGAFDIAQGGVWYRATTPNVRQVAPAANVAPAAGYPLGTSRFLATDASWPGVGVLTTTRDTNDTYTAQSLSLSSGEQKRAWVAGAWGQWNPATNLTASGTLNISANALASNGVATFAVTFPVGRFTVAPIVVCDLQNAQTGSASAAVRGHLPASTGFNIALYNQHPTSAMTFAATLVGWIATQMSPAAGGG